VFCRRRVAYLHGHYSVVYCDLFGEEVGANGCFVACAELLVDLRGTAYELSAIEGKQLTGRRRRHTYWFIRLVLPTPLSPKMMTCGGQCQHGAYIAA
jgi:hypothetical protein